MSKEIKLPSGSTLVISLPPFAEAKELFQAILEEVKDLKLDPKTEMDINFFKDIFCAGFSSKKIEKALNACMKRCTYNDLKMDENTFEDEKAREDYLSVVYEIIKEVISPFMKTLTALLPLAVAAMGIFPKQ